MPLRWPSHLSDNLSQVLMAKALLVVESPAKAKTIKRYLGDDFEVTASVGHIKDLPKNTLGVDVDDDFKPDYVTIKGKGKVLSGIKKLAKQVDAVYLAPDPDREGEAIAWHIADAIGAFKKKGPKTFRVLINEITKKGVQKAIANPTEIHQGRFNSQQARRILDRLVGYQLSPLLWDKVRRGLSAGRVQSVAVRLIVDREQEIRAFDPVEYWSIKARLNAQLPPEILASLHKVKGKKAEIANEAEAKAILDACNNQPWLVDSIVKRERQSNPPAPFTTSKLQQEAARRYRFSAKLTMSVAQRLYEGVEIGVEGAQGLITYMRTDSVRVSDEAITDCRGYIDKRMGDDFLPEQARVFKTKKSAQDAHEAIRPTKVSRSPEEIKSFLSPEQYKLYKLIWQRFVASQMAAAVFDQTRIDIANGDAIFRVSGSIMRFAGYRSLYQESTEGSADREDRTLPEVHKGEELKLLELIPEQHFTQPPPRFSEASLVKELEERGIGRPSTYASIISVIQDKGYVEKISSRFRPTELGEVVTVLLVESFPRIMDVAFTARMEDDLDRVEEGEADWKQVLQQFYDPFKLTLADAKENMRNVKREATPTDIDCDQCGKQMVIKFGRNGSFLACSGYPDCKNSMEYRRTDEGKIEPIIEEPDVRGECTECGKPMVVKTGRYGRFLACTGYPECRHTEPLKIGVGCPREDCEGDLIEKRSRRGKVFYGCNRYPDCDYATWNKPLLVRCPMCDAANLEEVSRRDGVTWVCPNCKHSQAPASEEAEAERA